MKKGIVFTAAILSFLIVAITSNAEVKMTAGDSHQYISFNYKGAQKWLVGGEHMAPCLPPCPTPQFIIFDAVANAYRMTIGSEGNVGIGTTSPTAPLHLGNSVPGGQAYIQLENANGSWGRVGRWTNRLQIRSSNAIGLAAGGTDGSGHLWITSSGNVGIGTTEPDNTLSVEGWGTFSTAVAIARPAYNTAVYGMLQLGGPLSLFCSSNNEVNAIGTDTNGNMIFYKNNGLSDVAMVINDDTGNVGIGVGTTNPVDPLHVVADAGGDNIYLEAASGRSWQMGLNWAGDFNFEDDGTIRVTFEDGGNVGIGTTDPKGKLDVNGPIYQRGIQLHADYVFEPGYTLESIEEHADFMFENKHLKAVPKAQIDENGFEIVEVGSHRRGLLEELEKAHIYIHQLSEQNKNLEERLAKLEALLMEK